MEFGIFIMKKYIIIVFVLFISIYIGYKSYLINEIMSVVNNVDEGNFYPSKKIEFIPSKNEGEYEISTNTIRLQTSVKFKKHEMEGANIRKGFSHFYWEEGDDYKSIIITDNSHKVGILESLNQKTNVNEFLRLKLTSDYDFHSYCFSLNYEGLTIFSSFHEIEVYPFCLISRNLYLYRKGGVFNYHLLNNLNVIQIGSISNLKVDLYFHNENKELFLLQLTNFNTDDLNLLLSTIENYESIGL
jgi:hypothetical protein